MPTGFEYVITRRAAAAVALTSAAVALTSCTQTDWANVEAQFASVITQIQAGVKAACIAAGTYIPTADSVLQFLIAALGSTTVQGVTAEVIKQAIDTIAAQCPTAPSTSPAARAPITAKVNGKEILINWY